MLDDRTKVRGDASGSALTLGLSHDAMTQEHIAGFASLVEMRVYPR